MISAISTLGGDQAAKTRCTDGGVGRRIYVYFDLWSACPISDPPANLFSPSLCIENIIKSCQRIWQQANISAAEAEALPSPCSLPFSKQCGSVGMVLVF